jgi:hypothetical protein
VNGRAYATNVGTAVLRASTGALVDSSIVTVVPAGQFSPPDIASTDFDLGSSSPFTTSDGSTTGNTDVNVIDDPTGDFVGKVARVHFVRSSTSSAPDVDRALRVNKGIHWGETVFVRGHVMIPTPQSHMTTAMRKLIYVQTGSTSTSFGVVRANGEQLYVEFTGTTTTARVVGAGAFAFDTRHSIEMQITVNSAAGVPDGILRLWKDGVLVIDVADVNWINSASASTNFSRFLFGQQTQGTSLTLFDEYRFWDKLAVSTKRIGPN